MDDDDPLRLALLASVRAADSAESAVRDGARGLTPDGERQLVERLARCIADRTEGMVERRTSRLGWRAVGGVVALLLAGMAAAGGVGYLVGLQNGVARMAVLADLSVTDPAVAEVWDRLIRFNPDPRRSLSDGGCRRTAVESHGFRGCSAPLWYEWVEPPSPRERKGNGS